MDNSRKKFLVTMLGNFCIEYDGKTLLNSAGKQKQVLNLLQYLIVKRNTVVTNEKLIDMLWPYQEISNPVGALKNLVYRTSIIVKKQSGDSEIRLIVSKHGNYILNDEYDFIVDAEIFDDLVQKSLKGNYSRSEKIAFLNHAIEIYKGDLLSSFSNEEWVSLISVRLKALLFECMDYLCKLYIEENNYSEAEKICTKAIEIDPFYEEANFMKITLLLKLGKSQAALMHYEYITSLYYKELGLVPSDRLKQAYASVMKELKGVEADLYGIKHSLSGNDTVKGAYCCDYPVFEQIYCFYVRMTERTADPNYLSLLTVKDSSNRAISSEVREILMEKLKSAIQRATRKSDVLARYNVSQYVLLLLNTTYEDTVTIDKRIKDYFKEVKNIYSISLETEFLPVEAEPF